MSNVYTNLSGTKSPFYQVYAKGVTGTGIIDLSTNGNIKVTSGDTGAESSFSFEPLYGYTGSSETVATREWVYNTTLGAYVTTDTNQSSIDGNKTWTGDQTVKKDAGTAFISVKTNIDDTATINVESGVTSDEDSRIKIEAKKAGEFPSSARLDIGDHDRYVTVNVANQDGSLPYVEGMTETSGLNFNIRPGVLDINTNQNSGTWMINLGSSGGSAHIDTYRIQGNHIGNLWGYEYNQLYVADGIKRGFFQTTYMALDDGTNSRIVANAGTDATWLSLANDNGSVTVNADLLDETYIQLSRDSHNIKITPTDITRDGISIIGSGGSTGVAAHASTHSSSGSDPITIDQLQVSNLTTDLTNKLDKSATEQEKDGILGVTAGLRIKRSGNNAQLLFGHTLSNKTDWKFLLEMNQEEIGTTGVFNNFIGLRAKQDLPGGATDYPLKIQRDTDGNIEFYRPFVVNGYNTTIANNSTTFDQTDFLISRTIVKNTIAQVLTSDTNVQRPAFTLRHKTTATATGDLGVILKAGYVDAASANEMILGAIDFVRSGVNGTGDVYLQSAVNGAYVNTIRLKSDATSEFFGKLILNSTNYSASQYLKTDASKQVISQSGIPWGDITSGVPTSFNPSSHASTHAGAGSDPITSLGALTFTGDVTVNGSDRIVYLPNAQARKYVSGTTQDWFALYGATVTPSSSNWSLALKKDDTDISIHGLTQARVAANGKNRFVGTDTASQILADSGYGITQNVGGNNVAIATHDGTVGSFYPGVTNATTLGRSTDIWGKAWVKDFAISGYVEGNLIGISNGTYSLGDSTHLWNNLWINNAVYFGTGSYYLNQTRVGDLTDGGDTTLHYHSSDRSWSNLTGKPSSFQPSITQVTDFNTVPASGFYDGDNNALNKPAASWHHLIQSNYSGATGSFKFQIAAGFGPNASPASPEGYYMRIQNNTSWYTWRELFHNGKSIITTYPYNEVAQISKFTPNLGSLRSVMDGGVTGVSALYGIFNPSPNNDLFFGTAVDQVGNTTIGIGLDSSKFSVVGNTSMAPIFSTGEQRTSLYSESVERVRVDGSLNVYTDTKFLGATGISGGVSIGGSNLYTIYSGGLPLLTMAARGIMPAVDSTASIGSSATKWLDIYTTVLDTSELRTQYAYLKTYTGSSGGNLYASIYGSNVSPGSLNSSLLIKYTGTETYLLAGNAGSSSIVHIGVNGTTNIVDALKVTAPSSPTTANIQLGFYGSAGTVKPTISGSKAGNAALGSLITALSNLGLITDATS